MAKRLRYVITGGIAIVISGILIIAYKEKLKNSSTSPQEKEVLVALVETENFSPPPDGIINEEKLIKFVSIKKSLSDELRKHKKEFRIEEEAMEEDTAGVNASFIMKQLSLTPELKRLQRQMLTNNNITLEEYNWINERLIEIIGFSSSSPNLVTGDWSKNEDMDSTNFDSSSVVKIPDENILLFEKYKNEIMSLQHMNKYGF